MASDDAIRATNDDAASCKRFAVQQGYWTDPYLQHFVRSSDRKAPEINRGYFARVTAVQTLLKKFITQCERNCQVINLGAGFDTCYWNLKDAGLAPKCFVDVDFSAVTTRKCHYIKQRKPLLAAITEKESDVTIDAFELHSPNYHIVPVDLRQLQELDEKLAACGIDFNLPTVVMSECVLVYMESTKSTALLKWITDKFTTSFFINYEQVNMGDRFGQVMLDNLRHRQCVLHGVSHCQTLDSQKQRFLSTGWKGAEALTMSTVYRLLPPAELQRIEKLEFMDEVELLDQLLCHYCLCWAYKDNTDLQLDTVQL